MGVEGTEFGRLYPSKSSEPSLIWGSLGGILSRVMLGRAVEKFSARIKSCKHYSTIIIHLNLELLKVVHSLTSSKLVFPLFVVK